LTDILDTHSEIVTVTVAFDRYLPSLNYYIGKNRHVYNNAKAYWSSVLEAALYGPTGDVRFKRGDRKRMHEDLFVERYGELAGAFSRIDVEGHVTYPARNLGARDQGNARSMLEKVLGDVLEKNGHFERGDIWDAYSFGGMDRKIEKGVSRTSLLIMARPLLSGPVRSETPVVDISAGTGSFIVVD
jgi:hypothetical protein